MNVDRWRKLLARDNIELVYRNLLINDEYLRQNVDLEFDGRDIDGVRLLEIHLFGRACDLELVSPLKKPLNLTRFQENVLDKDFDSF